MCAHATMSNFALLLKYTDEHELTVRLQGLISRIHEMDSEHNFDFRLGADLVLPQTNEAGRVVRRKQFSIENAYNNACAARAELGKTEESGIRIFESKLLEEKRWRDTVQEHQYTALKNEGFAVYYQSKYGPRTNELRGAEALVRWDSPEFGFVTPGRIIPIFEKNGFITEIDHYMIRHVARDQKAWLDADFFRGENAGERGEIVVSEAIKLAKSLDMRTVAEGVEEREQVEFLARQGCDMIQGFYYAKPMPKSEYTEKMTKTNISDTADTEQT